MQKNISMRFFVVKIISVLAALCLTLTAGSDTVYVVPSDTPGHIPQPPYATWQTAATDLSDALAEAQTQGWTNMVVSNGLYKLNSPLTINSPIYMRSWHDGALDMEGAILDGQAADAVTLDHADSLLEGFTITNAVKALLVNAGRAAKCKVSHNQGSSAVTVASDGILTDSYIEQNLSRGLEVSGGIAQRCLIANNTNNAVGGGVYLSSQGSLLDCVVSNNQTTSDTSNRGGGGVYLHTSGIISNCQILDNICWNEPGGGLHAYNCDDTVLIERCVFSGNISYKRGGGASIYSPNPASIAVMKNCLVVNNHASRGGGLDLANALAQNCTVVSNLASTLDLSIRGGGIVLTSGSATVLNSIIYHNSASSLSSSNVYGEAGITWINNCIAPDMNSYGSGNLTADPALVDYLGGNCQLTPASPCLNTGLNQVGMEDEKDLTGVRRIDQMSGLVDMGCYEYLPQGMLFYVK